MIGQDDIFGEHFGKPTTLWDPLEGLKLELPENQADQLRAHAHTVAVALGLAARAKGLP